MLYDWGGSQGLIDDATFTPRDAYYAFRLMTRGLQGGKTILKTDTNESSKKIMVTRDDTGIHLLALKVGDDITVDVSALNIGTGEAELREYSETYKDEIIGTASISGGEFTFNCGADAIVSAFLAWRPDNCLDFDGTEDYVDSEYTPSLTIWTVECWVKGDAAPATGNSCVVTAEENFQINWNHVDSDYRGAAVLQIGESLYPASFGTLEDNVWYHLAATYDGFRLKAYKNGVLITDNADPEGDPDGASTTMKIGTHATLNGYFDGKVDEVRVWKDVRTGNEIRDNMCRTLTGNEDHLAVYYTFDNRSGATLPDFSGNSRDGILHNMDNSDWAASSAYNTWLDADSSNWTTAANWSRGSVPGSLDNVGVYNQPGGTHAVLSGSPTVNHLLLEAHPP